MWVREEAAAFVSLEQWQSAKKSYRTDEGIWPDETSCTHGTESKDHSARVMEGSGA